MTGCAADGAPYVVRALLRRLKGSHPEGLLVVMGSDSELSPFANDSPEVPKLAAAFLDKDCVGARGLNEAEIAMLRKIAAPAAPIAPKP